MQPANTHPNHLIHTRELPCSGVARRDLELHKTSSNSDLALLEGIEGFWHHFFVDLMGHCKEQCLLGPVKLGKRCVVEITSLFAVRSGSHPRLCCLAVAVTAVSFSACGSGSGAAAQPAPVATTAQVRTYYDPESKFFPHESGPVLLGSDGQPSTIKHGLWTTWHTPNQGNTMQFEKTYINGTWNTTAYWREWNADTTLRFEGSDQ